MGDAYSDACYCHRDPIGCPRHGESRFARGEREKRESDRRRMASTPPLELVREGVMEELRSFSAPVPPPRVLFGMDASGNQTVTVRISVRTVAEDPDELPEFGPTFHVEGGYRMISGKSHDRSVALNYVKGATLMALGLRDQVPDVVRFVVEDP